MLPDVALEQIRVVDNRGFVRLFSSSDTRGMVLKLRGEVINTFMEDLYLVR